MPQEGLYMCEKFESNEAGFRKWLKENQEGYIINSDKQRSDPQYPKLHRASCKSLSSWDNYTTNSYYKICCNDKQALERHIKGKDGRTLTYCGLCNP